MLDKIRKYLLYAGINPANYEAVKPKILESNRLTVALISCCGTVLIVAMFISTFFLPGVRNNRTAYVIGMITALTICLLAFFYAKKHEWIVMPLVYMSYLDFYVF